MYTEPNMTYKRRAVPTDAQSVINRGGVVRCMPVESEFMAIFIFNGLSSVGSIKLAIRGGMGRGVVFPAVIGNTE